MQPTPDIQQLSMRFLARLENYLRKAARRGIRISVEIEKDLPSVMIDPVQLQQVLTNLMRNGIEAMDGVGGERRLSIRATQSG
jgi:signal transduction histidine kinase